MTGSIDGDGAVDGTGERTRVRIVNRQGLHARPIGRFVDLVKRSGARVRVTGPDGTEADGASVFSMMSLAAGQGSELALEASGPRAREVLEQLAALVADGFGEA